VILVGEMRDLDTIAAALTAAETGHLVLSTLHSGSAMQAIDRIIDVFPQHQQGQVRIQLSEVLRGVVTQRLLPTADTKGRVPVLEVVRMNYAFSNLIRDKKTHLFASQLQTTMKEGNVPFDVSLARVVKEGLVSVDAAMRAAHDPQYLRSMIGAVAAP
jgi:twitching motility protein PilT